MSEENPVWHWRKHPESVTADRTYTTAVLADKTVVATACGRLVGYQLAVGDPDEAWCPECNAIAKLEHVEPSEAKAIKESGRDDAIREWTMKCVELSKLNEEMLTLLRELEWSGWSCHSGGSDRACPSCDASHKSAMHHSSYSPGFGLHWPDCFLDSILTRLGRG